LVLLDDNLQTILDSVKDGRRIYQNITKAIGYVFAIHIPIALISLTAPLMGIDGESLMLLPLHIVLLELVMDPTCSVALERQPAEDEVMNRPPRNSGMKLMSTGLLVKSLMQGLAIYFVSFYSYYILLKHGYTAETARTAGYSILVLSNIFLVLVNCSEKESIIRILTKISKERGIWIVNLITLLELYIMIYTPAAKHLKLTPLPLMLNITVVSLAFISVFWYEFIKLIKRRNIRNIISKH
ncbi:MAG TPA: cation-translocating P-type ATPase, partial [Mobilitalea sp.]|nr:cation-translocating P-type ATPase [Mobilitalea sp.]